MFVSVACSRGIPRIVVGTLHCAAVDIGPLLDPVTRYEINYAGTQTTQWDFQNKGTLTSPARLSFVSKVSLRHLRPHSVLCDRIVQRAYCPTTVLYELPMKRPC